MSDNHKTIEEAFQTYLDENAKLTEKGVKASAARARKALQDMTSAIKERRKEIIEEKNAIGK